MNYEERSKELAPFPKPCTAPGCHRLTTSYDSRCDLHPRKRHHNQESKKASDDRRGSASSRGYDWRWKKLRDAYLAKNPLCEHCLADGRVTIANEVDHIVALRDGGARLDPSNLQSLCIACHRAKTQKEIQARKIAARLGELL